MDLPGFLPRADNLDHVTERRDDEHLDGLRKHRTADYDAGLEIVRVHFTPFRPALSVGAGTRCSSREASF